MGSGDYGVLGIGAFGKSVALALKEAARSVLVVDRDQTIVEGIKEEVTEAVIGDVTSKDLLEELRIKDLDAVIVCVGENFEASILATLRCKGLGCPYVVAKAINEDHATILKHVGADRVVQPEIEMARELAQELVNPNVMGRFVFADGYSVIRAPVPPSWIGKSIAEVAVRRKHGLSVIAIERRGPTTKSKMVANPVPEERFQEGDRLILFGSDVKLEALQSLLEPPELPEGRDSGDS